MTTNNFRESAQSTRRNTIVHFFGIVLSSISTLISKKLFNLGIIRIDRSQPIWMIPLDVVEINFSSYGIGNEIRVKSIIGFDQLPVAFSAARDPALENLFSRKVIVLQVEMSEIALRNDFGVPAARKSSKTRKSRKDFSCSLTVRLIPQREYHQRFEWFRCYSSKPSKETFRGN